MAQSRRAKAEHEQSPGIERDDDVPVGVQLAWRLRALIRTGRLGPGTRLPGVRELASGTDVNVNTARAVYRRLERDGLAFSRQGLGTFVAEHPGVSPALEQLAADTADTAAALGIDPRELAAALYVASTPGKAEVEPLSFDEDADLSEADERAARRTLRTQIARLEAELASYPEATVQPGEPTPRAFPFVAGVGELEGIRDQLLDKRKAALVAAEKKGNRQSAARAHLEEMVADPGDHRGEIVSSEELGDPGCTTWEAGPAWGPIGSLMKWWRVKVSSGCP
jgi:DNA-binding transcriptional regulator YhcF (GntR family)